MHAASLPTFQQVTIIASPTHHATPCPAAVTLSSNLPSVGDSTTNVNHITNLISHFLVFCFHSSPHCFLPTLSFILASFVSFSFISRYFFVVVCLFFHSSVPTLSSTRLRFTVLFCVRRQVVKLQTVYLYDYIQLTDIPTNLLICSIAIQVVILLATLTTLSTHFFTHSFNFLSSPILKPQSN